MLDEFTGAVVEGEHPLQQFVLQVGIPLRAVGRHQTATVDREVDRPGGQQEAFRQPHEERALHLARRGNGQAAAVATDTDRRVDPAPRLPDPLHQFRQVAPEFRIVAIDRRHLQSAPSMGPPPAARRIAGPGWRPATASTNSICRGRQTDSRS